MSRFSDDFSFKGSISREFPLEMEAFNSYDVEIRKAFLNKWAVALQSEDDIHSLGFYYYF